MCSTPSTTVGTGGLPAGAPLEDEGLSLLALMLCPPAAALGDADAVAGVAALAALPNPRAARRARSPIMRAAVAARASPLSANLFAPAASSAKRSVKK